MKEISRFLCNFDDIVVEDEFNSRKNIDPVALEGLAKTIDEVGLLNPLTVQEGGPSRTEPGKRRFFLIAGRRRYEAIKLIRENSNKFRQVEVKLIKGNAEENALRNLIENLQREQLEPLEEAKAMQRTMKTFGFTQAQLAVKTGKSEPYISQRLALLKNTAPEVKDAIEKGTLSPTHARELLTLPKEKQVAVLEKIEARTAAGEKVSVQDVKDEADKHKEALGIKREKKSSKQEEFDMEKVTMAKEIYDGQRFDMRPKTFVLEQIGVLMQRLKNPNISETTKVVTKGQVAALEAVLGIRMSL